MPCTPAVCSLPVEEARVQVVVVGTKEGEGIRVSRSNSSSNSSSSSSSSSNSSGGGRSYSSSISKTVTQDKIVGTSLAQIHLRRGGRFLRLVGYLPTHHQGLCRRSPPRR